MSGSVLQWFLSYLSNGYQRVVLDGAFSDWLPVAAGILQGSILGPQNMMPRYIQDESSIAVFAEDSKLSSSALLTL